MNIDHIVLWVDDPKQSLEFYLDVLGMGPVRVQEFEEDKAAFPSVRINNETIIDLMDRKMLSATQETTGGHAGGHPINHVCLNMNADDYAAIKRRLAERGLALKSGGNQSFGAQGITSHSEYFKDPDGNIIEIRFYE